MYTPVVDAAVSRFEMYHTATLLTSINPLPHTAWGLHTQLLVLCLQDHLKAATHIKPPHTPRHCCHSLPPATQPRHPPQLPIPDRKQHASEPGDKPQTFYSPISGSTRPSPPLTPPSVPCSLLEVLRRASPPPQGPGPWRRHSPAMAAPRGSALTSGPAQPRPRRAPQAAGGRRRRCLGAWAAPRLPPRYPPRAAMAAPGS